MNAGIKKRRALFIAAFTLPAFVLFLVFILLPILQGLYYSLFSWSGLSSDMTFLGLQNYRRLLTDRVVWQALGNDLWLVLWRLLFTLSLSLLFALILSRGSVLLNGLFRNVLFFPVMLSAVVICTVWMMMYNPSFGVADRLVKLMGLSPPLGGFLGDYRTALTAVVPPAVWCSVGFYMLIFLSAIEGIPDDLFESATIDGASPLRQTTAIILPLLRPQINFGVIYVVITSLNGSYLFVKLLTGGGPNSASEVLGTYLTLNGFNYHQFGYATAIGVLILVVTLLLSGALNRIFKAEAYEY